MNALKISCIVVLGLCALCTKTVERVFDFENGTFCRLKLGDDIETAMKIYGKPQYDGGPTSHGYVGRYDRRYLFGDVEIHCRDNKIQNIITSAPQIRTDRGLKRDDPKSRLLELYGEPSREINDGDGLVYNIGEYHLVVFVVNEVVDHVEVFGTI